jgi:DNA-binding PadR family transcriptional regulator
LKPTGRHPHPRGRPESRGEIHGAGPGGRPGGRPGGGRRGMPGSGEGSHHGGPGRGDWGHGGGKRVLAPGDLRPLTLSLVAEQPRYGYELMKAIEEMFSGAYTPSPGSIYPTLTMLEETGLLGGTADATGRRRYEITRTGQTWLEENADLVAGVRRRVEMVARVLAGRRPPEAIFQAMHTLKSALAMHSGAWTEVEVRRVAAIIDEAATRINEVAT